MYALPKTRRRIFFYTSALIFLAAAPFFVLYSLGYTFDVKRGTVEETGGIFVKTNQSGFTISLNNGAIQKSSLLTRGLLLSNLAPGQYSFRVEKEGYRSWEKIVSVTRFSVREIRDIILLPDPLIKEVITPWSNEEQLEQTFVSPKTHYAAFELKHKRTGRRTLVFFEPSANKITTRVPISEPMQEVLWNSEETAVLLVSGVQKREYTLITLSGALPAETPIFKKPITISDTAATPRITQKDIKKVRFGNETAGFVVLTSTNTLLFWDAATTSAKVLADGVEEFETLRNDVFFVAKNGFAARYSLRGNATVTLGRKGYALSGGPIQTLQTKRGDLFFKDGAGGLFFSSREGTGEFTLLETGVRDVTLDGAEKKLFFLKQNAVGLMHLEDTAYQPFEKRGNIATLFQSNDTAFLNAAWYTDGAHIFLNTASGVFLLDTDIREGPHIAELDLKPATTMFWNQDEKKLYLIRDTGIETIAIE